MTDVIDAAKQLRQRRQDLITAENRSDPAPRIAGKPEIKPGTSVRRGTTTQQALKSERPPAEGEGERAFGTPFNTTGN